MAALALAFIGAAPASAQVLSPGELSKAHARLDDSGSCNQCHTRGRGVDGRRCLRCHQSIARAIDSKQGFHARKNSGRLQCGHCHVEHLGRGNKLIRWPGGSASRFNHQLTGWPLEGQHAKAECSACHKAKRRSGNRSYLGTPSKCASCHEDVHEGRLGRDCQTCHNASSFRRVSMAKFDHGRTRYPLKGAHQKVSCDACHGIPAKYNIPRFNSCQTCHQDVHIGRFGRQCQECHVESSFKHLGRFRAKHPGVRLAQGHAKIPCGVCHKRSIYDAPKAGKRCISCHKPVHEADFGKRCENCHASIQWTGLDRGTGIRAHPLTDYALDGKHLTVPCGSCHQRDRYRGIPHDACGDCHQAKHKGDYDHINGGECGQCHKTQGFFPVAVTYNAHAEFGFALKGKHRAVPCGACHQGRRPRLRFQVNGNRCADCHRNPHGNHHAKQIAQDGCESCHVAAGFNQPKVDHSHWPLTGAHAETACQRCHDATPEDRERGRGPSYQTAPNTCAGCHVDVHGGQFVLTQPQKTCDACHTTTTFTVNDFAHEARTGFPLSGRHAKVPCGACHQDVKLRDGSVVQHFRLGYRRCADCHANPHAKQGAAR